MEEHENTAETGETERQNGAEMDGEIDRQVSVTFGVPELMVRNNTICNVRHVHYNV